MKIALQMPIEIGYMTLGKDMAPFHAIAQIKQTAQRNSLLLPI